MLCLSLCVCLKKLKKSSKARKKKDMSEKYQLMKGLMTLSTWWPSRWWIEHALPPKSGWFLTVPTRLVELKASMMSHTLDQICLCLTLTSSLASECTNIQWYLTFPRCFCASYWRRKIDLISNSCLEEEKTRTFKSMNLMSVLLEGTVCLAFHRR